VKKKKRLHVYSSVETHPWPITLPQTVGLIVDQPLTTAWTEGRRQR